VVNDASSWAELQPVLVGVTSLEADQDGLVKDDVLEARRVYENEGGKNEPLLQFYI